MINLLNEGSISESIIAVLLAILVIAGVVFVFLWPIRIVNRKNLTKNEVTTVKVLTFCGLITGVLWFVALCLAISYKEKD